MALKMEDGFSFVHHIYIYIIELYIKEHHDFHQLMDLFVFSNMFSYQTHKCDYFMGQSLWSMPLLQGIGVGGCRFEQFTAKNCNGFGQRRCPALQSRGSSLLSLTVV